MIPGKNMFFDLSMFDISEIVLNNDLLIREKMEDHWYQRYQLFAIYFHFPETFPDI